MSERHADSPAVTDCAESKTPSGCPGLYHIVDARDGGLCRVRLARGELSPAQACAIATAASTHAAGVIELTNRANLQLRGVRRGHHQALIDALLAAGLGPRLHAGDSAAHASARDMRRNVMISPAAGIDRHAHVDTRPLADALLQALQADPHVQNLSPKFAVLLDGGEALAETTHAHDIWLAAAPCADGTAAFAFGLAGAPPLHATDTPALGRVAYADAVDLVMHLIRAFLELAPPPAQRMRALSGATRCGELLHHARARGARVQAAAPHWRRPPPDPALRLGPHAQIQAQRCYVGTQAALGRLTAGQLRRLADLSRDYSGQRLRLTPWQGILIADVETARAHDLQRELQALELICDHGDPRAHLIACSGCRGCIRGRADTKRDAMRLATRLGHGLAPELNIHLSGCPRACAAAAPAAVTLLAVAPARYDIYQGDAASGVCIARHATIEDAATLVQHGG